MNSAKQCPRCGTYSAWDANVCGSCGLFFAPPPPGAPGGGFGAQPGFGGGAPNQYSGYPNPSFGPTTPPGFIQVAPGTHNVVLVAILSILFGGWLGAIINQQVMKGLLFWLLGGIAVSIVTCGLGAIVVYPLMLVDTIMIANRLNRGEMVRDWQFF